MTNIDIDKLFAGWADSQKKSVDSLDIVPYICGFMVGFYESSGMPEHAKLMEETYQFYMKQRDSLKK